MHWSRSGCVVDRCHMRDMRWRLPVCGSMLCVTVHGGADVHRCVVPTVAALRWRLDQRRWNTHRLAALRLILLLLLLLLRRRHAGLLLLVLSVLRRVLRLARVVSRRRFVVRSLGMRGCNMMMSVVRGG